MGEAAFTTVIDGSCMVTFDAPCGHTNWEQENDETLKCLECASTIWVQIEVFSPTVSLPVTFTEVRESA